jgi:hypothetical protein
MDENQNYLLDNLKSCCIGCKKEYSGNLVAAAAGDRECIAEIYNILAKYTCLKESYEFSPGYTQEQVISLSISQPNLLEKLVSQWEHEPYIKQLDCCSDTLRIAYCTATNFLKVEEIDYDAKPWIWEEYLNRPIVPDDIIYRPIANKFLTLEDIQKSVEIGGDALKGLMYHFTWKNSWRSYWLN